jgi:hypothetical protein
VVAPPEAIIPQSRVVAKPGAAERFTTFIRNGHFGRGAAIGTAAFAVTSVGAGASLLLGSAGEGTGLALASEAVGRPAFFAAAKVFQVLGIFELFIFFPHITAWVLQQSEKLVTGKISAPPGAKSSSGGH